MSDKIYITDKQLSGFAQAASITRNVLCVLPKAAQTEQPPVLTDTQQAALAAALRPMCVTRAEVLLHNDGLLMLLGAARGEIAALIGRQDDKNVLVPIGSGDLTSTVLAYLLENGEPNSAEASITTNGDSLLLLLAIADAYKRRYLAGLLSHEVQEVPITLDNLVKTIEEAYNESDTRWLFPFVLMTLDFPIIEDMQAALAGLYSGGILKEQSLALTSDGERLIDELMYLQAAVHLQTRRVRGEALLQEDILLLRTRESLWCAIVGKAESMLFTLSAEKMFDIVSAISEQLDEPRDFAEAFYTPTQPTSFQPPEKDWRCTCGSVNKGAFCPKCGTKRFLVAPAFAESWRCSCGSVNKGAFCPKCGAKRPQ